MYNTEHFKEIFIKELYKNRLFLTLGDQKEGWKLSSGHWTPFYFNLREMGYFPHILKYVAKGLNFLLENNIIFKKNKSNFGLLSIPTFGVSIGTALSLENGIPLLIGRKFKGSIEDIEESEHGQHRLFEGRINEGQEFIFVDDLVTSFGTVEYYKKLFDIEVKRRGLKNVKLKYGLVIVDREQGGEEKAKELGIKYYSLIRFKSEGLKHLKNELSTVEYKFIEKYLDDPDKFQKQRL